MFNKSLFAGIYVAIFIIGCNLKAATPFTIEYEKYILDNGLTVILHEDKSDPIVGVAIQYHVGSNRETPGRTGFAHLFEHLMFEGSKNCNTNWFAIVEPISTGINGSTNSDRTNYWENISPEYLERVIFMEADSMGYLT